MIFIIILILIHLMCIYICYKLKTNTDEFVQVYNYLKSINKSSILLFMNYRYTSKNRYNIIPKLSYLLSLLKIKFLYVINYLFTILNRLLIMLYARRQFVTTLQILSVRYTLLGDISCPKLLVCL